MANKLIEYLCVESFLSFAPPTHNFSLGQLNVLVGPNGAGKSNFLKAIELLKCLSTGTDGFFSKYGSVTQLMNKSKLEQEIHDIFLRVNFMLDDGVSLIEHDISFNPTREGVLSEELKLWNLPPAPNQFQTFVKRLAGSGEEFTKVIQSLALEGQPEQFPQYSLKLSNDGIPHASIFKFSGRDREQSVLNLIRDPEDHPAIYALGRRLAAVWIDESARAGTAGARQPARTDRPTEFLLENHQNLAAVLLNLQKARDGYSALLDYMRQLYPQFEDITFNVSSNQVELFVLERGLSAPVSQAGLSDGTLRFMAIAAVLLHPFPPPLLCFEEPEAGLHPDAIHILADLLLEAATRTQLIITTHSDQLVTAIGKSRPEAIILCERGSRGSQLQHLDAERLRHWLDKYTLGELWLSGELGGTRW